ncbi:hypothetical protein [Ancylobacter sp.]|uniref:hypothetical protein n=1 Tax=Ancylobacter sp. TaxID=1872567 RepID=UPI003C7DB295
MLNHRSPPSARLDQSVKGGGFVVAKSSRAIMRGNLAMQIVKLFGAHDPYRGFKAGSEVGASAKVVLAMV